MALALFAAKSIAVLGMAAYIEELTAAVVKQKNRPLADVQSSITPSKLTSLSGAYGKNLARNVGGGDVIEVLSSGVRTNIAHI